MEPGIESCLVTGGTGTLGQALLPRLLERGFEVHALYRSLQPDAPPGITWLQGDVTLPNLGLADRRWRFDRVYHVAGLVSLDDKDRTHLLQVNTRGTYQVVDFCQRNRIRRLCHISTAYVDRMELRQPARNAYEVSKWWAERYVLEASRDPGRFWRRFRFPLQVTIFRPSILVPRPGPRPAVQGFLQYVLIAAQVHRRAELVRRWVEGKMRLPPVAPIFRVRGDPQATLNLVSVPEVAESIARVDRPGVVWLTHPNPPTLDEVTRLVSQVLLLKMELHRDFRPSSVEALFQRLSRPFEPYLWGADLPSDLPASEVDTGFISQALLALFSAGQEGVE